MKNEEEYGEKMTQYMTTEGGVFPVPIKQESLELKELFLEGSVTTHKCLYSSVSADWIQIWTKPLFQKVWRQGRQGRHYTPP